MKVYIVEYGGYSDAYIDSVFTTRDHAETYVIERARRECDSFGAYGSRGRPFIERGEMTFDKWYAKMDDKRGDIGSISEYDVWDRAPIADLAT